MGGVWGSMDTCMCVAESLCYSPDHNVVNRLYANVGFPGGTVMENPPANGGDSGSITGQEDPLEKGTATQSSIFTWRVPWTEEPGGLQSMGLQRVRHD